MSKNVIIPLRTLEKIVELLDCVDSSGCKKSVRNNHSSVLRELKTKMQKIELRDSYTKVLRADGHDARTDALINYLSQKNKITTEHMDENAIIQSYYQAVCKK